MKQNETARYYIHRAEKIFRTVLISDVGGWWLVVDLSISSCLSCETRISHLERMETSFFLFSRGHIWPKNICHLSGDDF